VPVGPVVEPAAGTVDGLEPALARGNVHQRAEVAGEDASFAGHAAFLVRGEPLNLPHGQKEIREHERRAAEHAPYAAHDAAGSIQMEDVRVLVRKRDVEPVGRIADQFLGRGRRRRQLDDVVRDGIRPAVRHVVLIDEDHVHAARRHPERGLESRAHALGDRAETAGQNLFSLMGVHVEVRRAPGPEAQARIVARGRARERRRQEDQERRDANARPNDRHPSGT
jgi:hypothetical protein